MDNLPALSRKYDSASNQSNYFLGFPLGFIFEKKAYINNHVNIHLDYHKVDQSDMEVVPNEEEYRIVKIVIEPMSIHHEFKPIATPDDDAVLRKKLDANERVAKLLNPIASCDYKLADSLRTHTDVGMINEGGPGLAGPGLQKASRHVLFTYDVIWKENEDMTWSTRWDLYLNLEDADTNGEVAHWISVSNSIMMVILLSISVVLILLKSLRQDYHLYCRSSTDGESLDCDELEICAHGWHHISRDVFRPPPHPLLLAVLCGTGLQIASMTLLTMIFAMLGIFSPDERESLAMILMLLYVIMGYIAGYFTGRIYKSFSGTKWRKAAVTLSFGFPSLVFVTIVLMNIVATKQNHESVSFVSLIYFLCLWLGVSTPLVFLGLLKGYKVRCFEYPVSTSLIPRKIPRRPLWMNSALTTYFGSLVPFGVCFYEVMNVMSSVWVDEYYYIFGFLTLTVMSLMLTSAEIVVLINYRYLKSEDYRWWWRSFTVGAFTAVHIFVYALYYSTKLESKNPVSYIFYFGYMSLACFGISLMLGTLSLTSSLFFNQLMYKVYVSRCLKLS